MLEESLRVLKVIPEIQSTMQALQLAEQRRSVAEEIRAEQSKSLSTWVRFALPFIFSLLTALVVVVLYIAAKK